MLAALIVTIEMFLWESWHHDLLVSSALMALTRGRRHLLSK
jgi:hypothetical protein